MTILTTSAVLALIVNPACGNVSVATEQGREMAEHLRATVIQESGNDPFIIGVNADPKRGLAGGIIRSNSAAEAVAHASALLAQGRDLDLGLFGINYKNLPRHHLTLETAFDACRNTAAGAEHLDADFRVAAWEMAHRRYNCGRSDCGASYAASVIKILGSLDKAAVRSGPTPIATPPPVVGLRDSFRDPSEIQDLLHTPPKAQQ